MSKLTVRDYMTPAPLTIGASQTLALASALMRAKKIRHLPVLSEGKLVGMVSERDIALVSSMPNVDVKRVKVEEAMTPDPLALTPDSSLEWVALKMAEQKFGSAVVVDGEAVVGVFTTIDALRALQDLLGQARRRRSKRPVRRAA
jgi:acetoin utilization protein AcuB